MKFVNEEVEFKFELQKERRVLQLNINHQELLELLNLVSKGRKPGFNKVIFKSNNSKILGCFRKSEALILIYPESILEQVFFDYRFMGKKVVNKADVEDLEKDYKKLLLETILEELIHGYQDLSLIRYKPWQMKLTMCGFPFIFLCLVVGSFGLLYYPLIAAVLIVFSILLSLLMSGFLYWFVLDIKKGKFYHKDPVEVEAKKEKKSKSLFVQAERAFDVNVNLDRKSLSRFKKLK